MTLKLIYITVPNLETARDIAKNLLLEKLAACINILGDIESHYIWEDKLAQSPEILLIAKTSKPDELIKRAKELHPYQLPCIISLYIDGGLPDFLSWINTATNSKCSL